MDTETITVVHAEARKQTEGFPKLKRTTNSGGGPEEKRDLITFPADPHQTALRRSVRLFFRHTVWSGINAGRGEITLRQMNPVTSPFVLIRSKQKSGQRGALTTRDLEAPATATNRLLHPTE